MPAIDQCEPQVIRAFEKAGWTLLDHPFTIRLEDESHFYADLQLEQADKQILIIEVKCFSPNRSVVDEFYHLPCDWSAYRVSNRPRFCGSTLHVVPSNSIGYFRREVKSRRVLREALLRAKIKTVVVNLADEELVTWLD